MDKRGSGSKWAWLPTAMPGLAALMVQKRRELGDAHVNECWKRGVVRGEPGWFFAREGTLALGAPWADDPVVANFAAQHVTSTQVLLVLRTPEAADGTH